MMMRGVLTKGKWMARGGVRCMSASIDGLLEAVDGEDAKQAINRLKVIASEISALEAKYGGNPAPIDFAMYKSKLGGETVDQIETTYTQMQFPEIVTAEMSPEEEKELEAFLKEADSLIAQSKTRITELNKEVASLEAAQIGPETTTADIMKVYPDIEKEIDEEIHNHQWGKDINM